MNERTNKRVETHVKGAVLATEYARNDETTNFQRITMIFGKVKSFYVRLIVVLVAALWNFFVCLTRQISNITTIYTCRAAKHIMRAK